MPRRIDGEKITALQDEMNMTNADLARESGVSVSTIIRIKKNEAHNSSNFTVKSLAKAFGCQPADLYKEEAVKEAINESLAQTVSNVVAEAVAEAVTVVVDEVAPDASPETVAEKIPEMKINMPFDLNVQKYFDRRVISHQLEIEKLETSYSNHINDLRKGKQAWQAIAAVLALAVFVCLFLMR